jgi:transcriptional regulator with XRE-family HTH domain
MYRPRTLRRRRYSLGIPLQQVAQAVGSNVSTLSHLERGLVVRPELQAKVIAYLDSQERLARQGRVVAR